MYKSYQQSFNYLPDFVYLNPSKIFKAHFSFFYELMHQCKIYSGIGYYAGVFTYSEVLRCCFSV